ncbi:eukaryotic translation initiation factor 2A-like isoform X2 [Daphnia pulex]|uniref:eukaryotic translation initiation factor 2A-like isoform X2 n=1 Tax=Daphnia pulex TaxID=6669 RepID=UPI001EDE7AC8|nr:eukaryotic translation initiation factor 2A-like isoform X2 [Daphnia pulex]
MMSSTPTPFISCRGTHGVQVFEGTHFQPVEEFKNESSKTCRLAMWSPDGKYLAWANGTVVSVAETEKWSVIATFPKPKTSGLQFSPKGNFLVTWEPYQVTKDIPVNTPNLHIWNLQTKQSVKSYVQKNHSKWEPSWSKDEKLLSRNLNLELQVYEVDKMDSISQRSDASLKISDYSTSPGYSPYFFLCYIQGSKGQPSFAKLFKYPNLNPSGLVASKSFFQGDRVEMKWSKPGNCVLLMTSTDVDTSGASYYGKQTLHFLDVKGTSAMVQLPRDGPIYSVEWNPNGTEFCVVYGFMPAKATLYDLKCEAKFDFGTGPRNSSFYNPLGNILLLGGFGNLQGKIEIWDTQTLKLISPMDAPDTTHLQWSPDGQHFMTSTTAPRLRVSNGFKIWHYSGGLLFEHNIQSPNELWEATWQPMPDGYLKDFKVSTKKVAGIKPSQPQVSKELYRPPGARGTSAILKFLEEREAPSNPKAVKPVEKGPSQVKPNKRNERKIKKAAAEKSSVPVESSPPIDTTGITSDVQFELTGDETTDKKLKDLKKKLDQIARLKAEQSAGKKLEVNQVEKIQKESELTKQLMELSLKKK